jgi:copper resistance protein C
VTPTTAPVRQFRVRGLLIVFAVLIGLLLGTATAALAHTELASSNPADGSTLTGPLPAVELTFTGSVLLREVTVTGPAGTSPVTSAATVAGAVVTQPVALTDAGTYAVAYAVTSSDGHPVEGTLTFTYAPPSLPSPTSEAAVPTSTSASVSTPAAPSEAAADSPARSSTGLPGWAFAAGAAVVVAVAAAVLSLRRRRTR